MNFARSKAVWHSDTDAPSTAETLAAAGYTVEDVVIRSVEPDISVVAVSQKDLRGFLPNFQVDIRKFRKIPERNGTGKTL